MSKKLLIIVPALMLSVAGGYFAISNVRLSSDIVGAQEPCQATVGIVQPANNQQLGGIVPIELAANTGIIRTIFELNGNSIGRGSLDPMSGSQWGMNWDTRYASNGTNQTLRARVKYSNGVECFSQPISVSIANTAQLQLQAVFVPLDWSGPTNSGVLFSIEFIQPAAGTTVDIARFADVRWFVSGRGSVSPEPHSKAKFYSGPDSGNGTVEAEVIYGGQKVHIIAKTDVLPQYSEPVSTSTTNDSPNSSSDDGVSTTTTTDSSTSTSDSNSSLTIDPITGEPTEQTMVMSEPGLAITQIVEEDIFTKTCMINKLGQEAFDRLVAENRRPLGSEFEAYFNCFARQNYVLPSILAPVAPELVRKAPESKNISIGQIRNDKKTRADDSLEQTVLVLSGKAAPNSTVLIYVFSEPLVLATTADSEGNWSYSLEDPLESGRHEVYALVDNGNGEYERSGVASFIIGTAEATSENPNGFSLDLAAEPTVSPSNRSVNVLIAATLGTSVFTIIVFIGFMLIRRNNAQAQSSSETGPDANTLSKPDGDRDNFYDSL